MKTIREGNFTATFPEDYKPGKQYNGKRTFGKRELNSRCNQIQRYLKKLYDGDPETVEYLVDFLRANAAGGHDWFRRNDILSAAYDQLPESIKTPITNKALSR
ncbi:hypothetical protein PM116P4_00043 [Parabacteroides phage PM116P4]|nr:hypothetical protein PM116P4_00043 [Parabacteroides phage PM116P4]WAX17536.1 hypothetical protein PM116P5_00020 [Parabacteroides phage PM116P5]